MKAQRKVPKQKPSQEDKDFYYYNTEQEQRNAVHEVMQQRGYSGYGSYDNNNDYIGYIE